MLLLNRERQYRIFTDGIKAENDLQCIMQDKLMSFQVQASQDNIMLVPSPRIMSVSRTLGYT